jgi:hypothetical protein
MLERQEVLWRYFKDCVDHSRHHEILRATATNIVVAVSAAGFAVVGYDKSVTSSDVSLLVFLFGLGLFGAVFAALHTERADLHYERARELRSELDKTLGEPTLVALKDIADKRHEAKYKVLHKRELRHFWYALHLSISSLALVLLVIVAQGGQCK